VPWTKEVVTAAHNACQSARKGITEYSGAEKP
jgi:hypothetical protein